MAADVKTRGYVFLGEGRGELQTVDLDAPGPNEALVEVKLASLCATDLKVIAGRIPSKPGTIMGHEFVGEVAELGPGVEGYEPGQRVVVLADTPCGVCEQCLANPQGRGCARHGSIGGYHFGVLRHGAHAKHVVVPFAEANLAPIPDSVSNEQALMLCDVTSTGFAAVESSELGIGDSVVIVGQGPVGLCATVGARLRGATLILTADPDPWRREVSRQFGADCVIDPGRADLAEQVAELTGERKADVAIEAVGTPQTFLDALRAVRPAGTVSSVGNYGMEGELPLSLGIDAFMGGIGNIRIVSSASPGGKDRARRLLGIVASGRFDSARLVTHRFSLDEIDTAYEHFRERRDNVLKVAIAA